MKINVGKNDICYTCKFGKQVVCDAKKTDINFDKELKCIVKCGIYEKKISQNKPRKFVKPTVDEVNAYALEKGYTNVDGQEFIDYFDSVGWKVGKTLKPMVCWRKAVSTWNRRHKGDKNKLQSKPSYDLEKIKRDAMENTEI